MVTGSGRGAAYDVALALGRAGAAVLCADPALASAESTAEAVRRSRVVAWAIQCDLRDEQDAHLLAARARDLGGADLLVVGEPAPAADQLVADVRADAERRPARRAGTPRVVTLGPSTRRPEDVLSRLRRG